MTEYRTPFLPLVGGLLLVVSAALLATPAHASGGQCPDDFVNWADRLGYGESERVIIAHADDAGSFLGANSGIEEMLESGKIDSASVMVPAPFYGDMVDRYNANQDLDLGLHITLNSRANYAWSPVYEPTKGVKRILKHRFLWWGWRPYFPSEWFYTWLYRGPQAVEREIGAQIDKALVDMTAPPTHIDSHVGAVFARKSHFKKYLLTAKDRGVAAMTFENWPKTTTCMSGLDEDDPVVRLSKMLTDRLKKQQRGIPDWPFPRIDLYCVVPYGADLSTTRTKLKDLIRDLPAGITQILFHPADEDPLIRALFPQHLADRRILIDRHLFDTMTTPDALDTELLTVRRTNWRKMSERFTKAQAGDLCTDPGDGQPWDPPSCCS